MKKFEQTIRIAGIIGILGMVALSVMAIDHKVEPATPIIKATHTWSFTHDDVKEALLLLVSKHGETVPEGEIEIDGLDFQFEHYRDGTAYINERTRTKPAYDKTGNPPKQVPPAALKMTVKEIQK
jgi:hypothetical protein